MYMELYQFLLTVSFVRYVGIFRIFLYTFCVLMARHLNKKYLSDDKKYKLLNKYKYLSYNKFNLLSERALKFKVVGYSYKIYVFGNKYYKLALNEVICMFTDLFNEVAIVKIEKKLNPNEINMVNNLLDKFTDQIDNLNSFLPKTIEQESNKVKEVFNELKGNKDLNLIDDKINKSLDLLQKLKKENNYQENNSDVIDIEDETKVTI